MAEGNRCSKSMTGGTTLEIRANRLSVLCVPTKGIINNKIASHGNLFPVMAGVTVENIAEYLSSNKKDKKLITTPDSFGKIIAAANSIGKLNELYRDFFLLMDELHTAITDAFRLKILEPFEYFWNFVKVIGTFKKGWRHGLSPFKPKFWAVKVSAYVLPGSPTETKIPLSDTSN